MRHSQNNHDLRWHVSFHQWFVTDPSQLISPSIWATFHKQSPFKRPQYAQTSGLISSHWNFAKWAYITLQLCKNFTCVVTFVMLWAILYWCMKVQFKFGQRSSTNFLVPTLWYSQNPPQKQRRQPQKKKTGLFSFWRMFPDSIKWNRSNKKNNTPILWLIRHGHVWRCYAKIA